MAKYKNIVPKDTKAVIKPLGIELRGGFFYEDKLLKQIYDAGFTNHVEKVTTTKKTKKDEKNEKDTDSDNTDK